MKRLAFGIGILTLGLAATTPARADYTVVKFADGYCQIWWDSAATPWGVNWAKIAIAPDWWGARTALDAAIANRTCN
jgi:hypothetical protein